MTAVVRFGSLYGSRWRPPRHWQVAGIQNKMSFNFEWNPKKAAANDRKHGITFEEASTVFADYLSLTIPDPLHSENEERFVTTGRSEKQRLIVVVHTERGNTIRIISARTATPHERKRCEEGDG